MRSDRVMKLSKAEAVALDSSRMSPEGDGYSGPATLAQGERRVEIQCGYSVMESMDGDLRQWRGWYKGADVASEPDAGEAQLTLPSGATATIEITRALTGTGEGTFTGLGDPPAQG
jgi:hypothetical protein